jgi:hypothetical protein
VTLSSKINSSDASEQNESWLKLYVLSRPRATAIYKDGYEGYRLVTAFIGHAAENSYLQFTV